MDGLFWRPLDWGFLFCRLNLNYTCRDCGEQILGSDKLNRCPVCNSMYLIPQNDSEDQSNQGSRHTQSSSYSQLDDFPGSGRKITLGGALLVRIFGLLTWLLNIFYLVS